MDFLDDEDLMEPENLKDTYEMLQDVIEEAKGKVKQLEDLEAKLEDRKHENPEGFAQITGAREQHEQNIKDCEELMQQVYELAVVEDIDLDGSLRLACLRFVYRHCFFLVQTWNSIKAHSFHFLEVVIIAIIIYFYFNY